MTKIEKIESAISELVGSNVKAVESDEKTLVISEGDVLKIAVALLGSGVFTKSGVRFGIENFLKTIRQPDFCQGARLFYEYGIRALQEVDLMQKMRLETLGELRSHEHYEHFVEGRLDARFLNHGAIQSNAFDAGLVPAQKEFQELLDESEPE